MSNYRRAIATGGTFFFTQVTYQRIPWLCSDIGRENLRKSIRRVQEIYPFSLDAIALLPEHIHCIWTLPKNDSNYAISWRLIKSFFGNHIGLIYMNNKKLPDAQDYTYEARKDVRWLHRIIEVLQQNPEEGRYDDEEQATEVFTNETIEVARKLMQLMEIEKPQPEDIRELYNLLKFYQSLRNSNWDHLCRYVEQWHWVANIWDSFDGVMKLDLWNNIECTLYSLAKPLIAEGKFLRQSGSIDHYGHVIFKIEPQVEENNIQIIWQINDDNIIPFYYIPATFEGIIDGLIKYFHQTDIALTFMKIIVYDGSHHEVDSRELDYRIAAGIGWRKALANAEFVRL